MMQPLQPQSAPSFDAAVDKIRLDPGLSRELHGVDLRPLSRLLVFLALYAAGAGMATLVMTTMASGWRVLLALPGYLLAAASLHGIGLFTHDGVHGVLARNRHLNRALSMACAWPTIQNHAAYRVLHLRHHAFLGKEGDPDHYANYTSWTWMEFLMHGWRFLFGGYTYLIAIPILGLIQAEWSEKRWILFEVFGTLVLFWAVWQSPLPKELLLHGWAIPSVFINFMINVRGMSQHTFLTDYANPFTASRSITTTPLVRFFMCNENYHLEHHLFPGVPWHHLERLHHHLKDELEQRQATFIPSYMAFVREFVTTSVRLVRARKPARG